MKKLLLLSILFCVTLISLAVKATASGPYAYIVNGVDNTVSIIDTSTNAVVATVPVGTAPLGAAVTPDGTRLYVSNQNDNTVSVIDTSTNTVVATLPVGTGPHWVALNPAGTRAYVPNWGDNTVSVIDTSTDTVVATVPVGTAPSGVAVTPDGTKAYVPNYWHSYNVSVIDTSTNTVVDNIWVDDYLGGVTINPDGTRLYVIGWYGLYVIDMSTDNVIGTVMPLWGAWPAAFTPDGQKAYIPHYYSTCWGYSCYVGNEVAVIDTSTISVIATIQVGTGPGGAAVTPDGTRLYVSNQNDNTVSVIDTSTDAVVATVPVGAHPYGIAIGPAKISLPPVALCKDVTVTADSTCTASASINNGSYDPDGDQITLTQSPTGPYPKGSTLVTLTVTDSQRASSQCTGTVTVVDNTPPTISAVTVNPSVLWPPNHKMVNVTINYNATDNCDQPICQISSVTCNEPISGSDYAIVDAHHVKLSADRLGSGSGRIYTIAISCKDASGNSSIKAVTVSVPHDQGK